ncbi:MAG TPA: hypothetical protein VJ818_03830 [Actinomycetota bacterium]|nr:hypothetical protein [Actinomycetota bacterium]
MNVGARSVALIAAGTLAAALTACPRKNTPVAAPIAGAGLGSFSLVKPDVGVADPPLLQRPLRLPRMTTSGRCPITAGADRSSVLGTGPVRLIIDVPRDANGVFHYGSAPLYDGWRLIASRWVVEPDAKGPIFLHGARLDANLDVLFVPTADSRNMYRTTVIGPSPEIEVYRWLLLPARASTRAVTLEGGMAALGPGCFGVQADGTGFTSTIVFRLER